MSVVSWTEKGILTESMPMIVKIGSPQTVIVVGPASNHFSWLAGRQTDAIRRIGAIMRVRMLKDSPRVRARHRFRSPRECRLSLPFQVFAAVGKGASGGGLGRRDSHP